MGTLVPAVIGGVVGYAYAKLTMNLPEKSSMPAVYGAAGAAVFVLSVRLASLLRAIYGEFRKR
jgi:ABC-type Co2+ transport system permease subunit